jgi:hypothetical protein
LKSPIALSRACRNTPFRFENASKAWQPDAALRQRLSDIGGIFNPLGLASYETYRGGMGDRGSPLYNFLGAKYVLANKDQSPGDASFVPVFNGDPQIDVYLNTNALPRAQLIERSQSVSSGEEAWQAIHAPEFKPSGEVVVEGGPALDPRVQVDGERNLAFTHYSNERVELSALTPHRLLVLSDVLSRLDGDRRRSTHAGVSGEFVFGAALFHRASIVWRLRLSRNVAGWAISALTVIGIIGFGIWHWQRGR